MSDAVRVLAYAWNHEGLGHVARLLNVIGGIKELRPDTVVNIVAEQYSALLRRAGHPFVAVPAHKDSYLGTVYGAVEGERPLERAVAAAVIDAAVRVARPTVVLHDTIVSAGLLHAAPPPGTPHVLITRRSKSTMSFFESLGAGIRDIAMVIIAEDRDEVAIADIPELLRSRVMFSGPIVRPTTACGPARMRSRYRVPEGSAMFAVTGGGGGFADQHAFFDAAARAIARLSSGPGGRPAVGVMVLGYFFDGIVEPPAAPGLTWRITRHEPDLTALMRSADVVIAQGGYNTLFEARSVGARVVAVPGTRFSDDQVGRVRHLTRDYAGIVAVDVPDADVIAAAITSVASRPRPSAAPDVSGGRERAAQAIIELAEGRLA